MSKKKKSLISYRVYGASDNSLFWGHHSLGIVVRLFCLEGEGVKEWGRKNKGFCIIGISDGSKVPSKASILTSLRGLQSGSALAPHLNNFHRDFPLIRAVLLSVLRGVSSEEPSCHQGSQIEIWSFTERGFNPSASLKNKTLNWCQRLSVS